MVDYVECIDGVTTLTITPKPGAGGSSPSTPANQEPKVEKGFKINPFHLFQMTDL